MNVNMQNVSCHEQIPQSFLICVTVHKAQDLIVLDADTFVVISFHNTSNRTRKAENCDSPFFNEYFVFEIFKSLTDLLKMHIHFVLYKKTCCVRKNVVVGEFSVDLNTIWEYPNHFVYKKWVALENPADESEQKVKGHLQIDVSIISKFDKPAPVSCEPRDYDTIEANMLEPIRYNIEQQSIVKFVIKIYSAKLVEKGQFFIKFILGSIQAKTKIVSDTAYPEWNEQFDCITLYPSSCNTLVFQIHKIDLCTNYVWSEFELNFENMTNCISLYPVFGPTYVNFYDVHTPRKYIGRLLVAVESETFSEKNKVTRYNVRNQNAGRLNDTDFWTTEIFHMYLYIFELNCISTKKNKIKMKFSCGESTSNEIEFMLVANEDTPDRKYCQIPTDAIPMLMCSLYFPDNRLKFESDIMIERAIVTIRKQLDIYKLLKRKGFQNVKYERRYVKHMYSSFTANLKEIQVNLYFKIFKEVTPWDRNHMNYKLSVIENIVKQLGDLKNEVEKRKTNEKHLKIIYETLEFFHKQLRIVNVFNLHDRWPDIFITLSIGNVEVAYYRANPKHFLFHQNPNCFGLLTKVPYSIVFRPVSCKHSCANCGCVFAHSFISMWIGIEAESFNSVPEGISNLQNHFAVSKSTNFMCNIYIHQAKLRHLENHQVVCNGQMIFFVNNQSVSTSVVLDSLSPVWNETLTINQISLVGSPFLLRKNPPWIVFKLVNLNEKKNTCAVMGTSYTLPAVKVLENDSVLQKFVENEINLVNDTTEKSAIIEKNIEQSPRKRKALALPDIFRRHKDEFNIDYLDCYPPPLQWIPIFLNGNQTAEVLVSVEFTQNCSSLREEEIGIFKHYELPFEIRPNMVRFKLEIIFYGLRNASELTRQTIGRYRIQSLIGELVLETGLSGEKYGKSLNFLDPYVVGMVNLPEQFVYWPPLILKHIECVKHDTVLSVSILPNPEFFFLEDHINGRTFNPYFSDTENDYDFERKDNNQPLLEKSPERKAESRSFKDMFCAKPKLKDHPGPPNEDMEKRYSWWTKFHNSIEKNPNKHQLVIFGSELEDQLNYSALTDWAVPVPMTRNETSHKTVIQQTFSTLKCKIQITKSSSTTTFPVRNSLSKLFLSKYNDIISETPIVLRIYVVQGLNLRSRDANDLSDPYIVLHYGDTQLSDRSHYQENQSNPIFGRKFEINGSLPKDQYLSLSIFDRDTVSKDDLIGTTKIDIEDRLRSKHRAYCGIAKEYCKAGYNIWRDYHKPSEILLQICEYHNLGIPKYVGKRIQVADVTFEDETDLAITEDAQERLSLSVLHNLDKIPEVRFKLIPEHVETRSLFRDDRPGIEQGKVQMWIDIFSPEQVPIAIDIAPEPARIFELRAIIWDTKDVILDEKNVFGTAMSDIYVKGWLESIDDAQFTDIHYRSMNGTGNFNWRMVFRMKYLMAQEMMVVTQPKSVFEKCDTLVRTPPIFNIQIWDSDAVSADDFLGSLSINLANFSKPFSSSKNCKLAKYDKPCDVKENLFLLNKIRGWFPCRGFIEKSIGQTGKIDLELEIMSEDQADMRPVGLGQDGPEPLPPPDRPDTSFSWWRNPMKAIKVILWPQIKKCCIYCCLVLIVLLVIAGIVGKLYLSII